MHLPCGTWMEIFYTMLYKSTSSTEMSYEFCVGSKAMTRLHKIIMQACAMWKEEIFLPDYENENITAEDLWRTVLEIDGWYYGANKRHSNSSYKLTPKIPILTICLRNSSKALFFVTRFSEARVEIEKICIIIKFKNS